MSTASMSTASSRGPGAAEALEWFEVRRPTPQSVYDLADLEAALGPVVRERVPAGARAGVAVGSRGISRLAEVVEVVVRTLRSAGAQPVLVPAMGSHGGATPEGQAAVLEHLGVSPARLGVPLDASMEVVEVGRLSCGKPFYLSKSALACDVVVPVNRVKPHTDFRAPVESGLTKMLTIGLGKELGASSLHSAGFSSFAQVLPEAMAMASQALEVPFGVALLEDAWHRLRRAEVVPGERILERDEQLLAEAWQHFGALPFDEVDLLVLREMGKTISGAGMDPNVTGRFPGSPLPARTSVARLVALDLTDGSGGNAIGVGMADVIPQRLRDKVDWAATYANALASKSLAGARLPMVVGTDAEAIEVALSSLVGVEQKAPAVVAMASTLEVGHLAVSGPLLGQAKAAGYEQLGPARRAEFSPRGSLVRIGSLEFFPSPWPLAQPLAAGPAPGPLARVPTRAPGACLRAGSRHPPARLGGRPRTSWARPPTGAPGRRTGGLRPKRCGPRSPRSP